MVELTRAEQLVCTKRRQSGGGFREPVSMAAKDKSAKDSVIGSTTRGQKDGRSCESWCRKLHIKYKGNNIFQNLLERYKNSCEGDQNIALYLYMSEKLMEKT